MLHTIFNLIFSIYHARAVRVGREVHTGHFVFNRLVHINPKIEHLL